MRSFKITLKEGFDFKDTNFYLILLKPKYVSVSCHLWFFFSDLFYYDQLSRIQDKIIKLTIDCSTNTSNNVVSNDEHLVSPIEHCLRTKWRDANIDWNGSEPIL